MSMLPPPLLLGHRHDGPHVATHHLLGLDVIVHPHLPPRRPRYQLPPDFGPLPPGFREGFNAWALQFFGTEAVAYVFDGRAVGLDRMGVYLHPECAAILKGLP